MVNAFCLSDWESVVNAFCLSVCLSVCLSACLSVCLSVTPRRFPIVHIAGNAPVTGVLVHCNDKRTSSGFDVVKTENITVCPTYIIT